MAAPESIQKISTLHLAWAAGFIEGEGSFSGRRMGGAIVTAAQIQREPLDRLQALFGGKITQRYTRGFGTNPIWVWKANAHRSIQIMMTLYVLMSPRRREQIEAVLARWKKARLFRAPGSSVCARGHHLSGHNLLMVGHYRKCRACKNMMKRRRRAAAKPP